MEELMQQGIRSSQDVQRARSELDATAARVTAGEAALRSAAAATATAALKMKVAEGDVAVSRTGRDAAAAAVRQATAALDKMDVRAPFDGIVVLKDAEVGEVVSPNSQGGSNARGSVCTMVDFDSLEVQANVAETALPSVVVGAKVDCYLDLMPSRRYPGVVDRIWPTADRQRATVEVRIKLLERDDLLRPELGARIVFRGEAGADAPEIAGKPAILVPAEALVLIRGQEGVFVLERDVVRFQALTLGERRSGRAVVKSGLKVGDRIVANPPVSLQDGDRVRIEDS
jgi:HlyD family secretion protein